MHIFTKLHTLINKTKLLKKAILTIFVVFMGALLFTSTAHAAWYNTSYAHRKSHLITGAANAGTNYQVKITAYKGTGTDSAGVVYLGTGIQDDFDDVRFTDNDETTPLDFWIASTTVGVSAEFWVEVADTLTSDATIYVYYENAAATTASNGSNTFLFFDDFSGDLSKWTIDAENTDKINIVSGALRHDPDSSQTKNVYFDTRAYVTTLALTDFSLNYKTYLAGATNRKIHQMGWRTDGLTFNSGYAWRNQNSATDGGFFEFAAGAWTPIGTAYAAVAADTWLKMEVKAVGSAMETFINGSSVKTVTDATTSGGSLTTHVHGINLGASDYVLIDDVYVRKLVATEPAHSTWGGEENVSNNRYWVGGGSSANWNATGPTNWSESPGGANNASVPGPSDDVFFTADSSAASTLSASITINSLDMTGYVGTLTHNAGVALTIDGNGVNFKLASGMTYTLGDAATSAITFTGTSGTTLITTAGKTVGNMTFDGVGGTWQLQDGLTAGSTAIVTLTAGSFNTNNQTINIGFFSSVNSNTRALTLGSSAITVSGTSGNPWDATGTGMTLDAGSSTITLTGNAGSYVTFRATGAYTWNNVVFSGTRLGGYTGGNVANFTYTGPAEKTSILSFTGGFSVTGTFTVNGNSATDRVLVTSSILGTPRTITAANVSVTNADFRDITGAGAGNWNLSAITGLSGDAGGNSGITFTTPQTQYWTGNTGSWSVANQWCTTSGGCSDNAGNGRVPLPQDDVIFDNGSFSTTGRVVTMDMPRTGKNIDAGTTYNEGQSPLINRTSAGTIYGSLTLSSGIGWNNGSGAFTFEGRGAYTFTSAGQSWGLVTYFQPFGGSYTLQDAFSIPASTFYVVTGTFDANDFNVTAGSIIITNSSAVTINMGSGTWITNSWTLNGTSPTINAETSTILISNTSTVAKTFAGAGKTYNNVEITGSNITFTGSNTFNNLALNNAGVGIGTRFTNGTTQTVTTFETNGSAGNLVYASSTSASATATIAKAGGGTICEDYMHVTWMTGSPADTWYVGVNSTDGGNNSGLSFSGCAVPEVGPNTDPRGTSPANVEVKGGMKIKGGTKFK